MLNLRALTAAVAILLLSCSLVFGHARAPDAPNAPALQSTAVAIAAPVFTELRDARTSETAPLAVPTTNRGSDVIQTTPAISTAQLSGARASGARGQPYTMKPKLTIAYTVAHFGYWKAPRVRDRP